MFKIYKSEYNPANLTGIVGGGIGSEILSGYPGEVFYHISSPPSGIDTTTYQYRKVFIKNTFITTSTNVRVWIDAVEHEEQISISISASLIDTGTSPLIEPTGVTGWVAPTNYAEGLSLGTLTANSYTGIWIREALSGISIPDPFATFRLVAGGLLE